jgi:nicotinamidase/pyrazinamidase
VYKNFDRCVLVIVDMQNDFMPGGALGVPNGNQVVPILNVLMPKFPLVVATQDWHPADHVSFAPNHPGKKVGDSIKVDQIDQILWPIHCVRNTHGAELISTLNRENIASFFFKGTDKNIDSYSAFFDNAHRKSTGLGDYLKSRGITDIYLAGVATDYCVLYSTMDAVDLGFTMHVIADACRAINLSPRDDERAFEAMRKKGAKVITSKDM